MSKQLDWPAAKMLYHSIIDLWYGIAFWGTPSFLTIFYRNNL